MEYLADEITIQIKLPQEIRNILKGEDLSTEVRLLMSLELYREGAVSIGKGAEIAGLKLHEFMNEFRERGIAFNYDLEEVERDIKTLEEL